MTLDLVRGISQYSVEMRFSIGNNSPIIDNYGIIDTGCSITTIPIGIFGSNDILTNSVIVELSNKLSSIYKYNVKSMHSASDNKFNTIPAVLNNVIFIGTNGEVLKLDKFYTYLSLLPNFKTILLGYDFITAFSMLVNSDDKGKLVTFNKDRYYKSPLHSTEYIDSNSIFSMLAEIIG